MMLGRWTYFVMYWQDILNFTMYAIFWCVIVWNIYHVVAVFLLSLVHIAVKLDIYHRCCRVLWNRLRTILWAWMAVMTTLANVCYCVLIWNSCYNSDSFLWLFKGWWQWLTLYNLIMLDIVCCQRYIHIHSVLKVDPAPIPSHSSSYSLINFTNFCLPVFWGWYEYCK